MSSDPDESDEGKPGLPRDTSLQTVIPHTTSLDRSPSARMTDNSNHRSQIYFSTTPPSGDSDQQRQRSNHPCIFSDLLYVTHQREVCYRPPAEKPGERTRNALCCSEHNHAKHVELAEYVIQSCQTEYSKIEGLLTSLITEADYRPENSVLLVQFASPPQILSIHSVHLVFRTPADRDRVQRLFTNSNIAFSPSSPSLNFKFSDKGLSVQGAVGAKSDSKFKVKVRVIHPLPHEPHSRKRPADSDPSLEHSRRPPQPEPEESQIPFDHLLPSPVNQTDIDMQMSIPNFPLPNPLPVDHLFESANSGRSAPIQNPSFDAVTSSSPSHILSQPTLSSEGRNQLADCIKAFDVVETPMKKLSRWANQHSSLPLPPPVRVADPSDSNIDQSTNNQIAYDRIPMDEAQWHMKYVALDAMLDPVAETLNKDRKTVLKYWEEFWVHADQPGFLEACKDRSWPGVMRFRDFLRIIEPMEKGHYLLVRGTYIQPQASSSSSSSSSSAAASSPDYYPATTFKQTRLCKQMRAMALDNVALARLIMDEKKIAAAHAAQEAMQSAQVQALLNNE